MLTVLPDATVWLMHRPLPRGERCELPTRDGRQEQVGEQIGALADAAECARRKKPSGKRSWWTETTRLLHIFAPYVNG